MCRAEKVRGVDTKARNKSLKIGNTRAREIRQITCETNVVSGRVQTKMLAEARRKCVAEGVRVHL